MRGVGLLEVLLAAILLSIGLLASARLQIQGLADTQGAYALSQAKYLALDMAERMRANKPGLRAGLYDGLETASGTAVPDCVAGADPCSAADRVAADRHAWSLALHPDHAAGQPVLPSSTEVAARGRVRRDAATGVYTVSVEWADRQSNSASSADADVSARSIALQVVPASLP